MVLSVLFKVNRAFNANLRVTDVYKSPTILELAQRVLVDTTDDEFVDLQQEAPICPMTSLPSLSASLSPRAPFCSPVRQGSSAASDWRSCSKTPELQSIAWCGHYHRNSGRAVENHVTKVGSVAG